MLATLALAAALRPFPIPAVSLMEHCLEADLVVVARPGPTVPVEEPGREFSFESEVTLEVQRTIAGPKLGRVTVRYSPGLICPAPASYPEGVSVLTFLVQDEAGHFRPNGLSYGTKFPTPGGLEAYAARIVELRELITRQPDSWAESEEMVDWALRCLEHPETRGDGLTALSGGYLGGWRDEGPPSLVDRLDVHRSLRILDVFRAAEVRESADVGLVRVLRNWRDPAVDRAILAKLRTAEIQRDWHLIGLIEALRDRWQDERLDELLLGHRELGRTDPQDDRLDRTDLLLSAFWAHVDR